MANYDLCVVFSGSKLPEFPGKTELVAFFSWLDFVDSLIKASCDVIAAALALAVKENFLRQCLEVTITR